ncbi:MAG TPA: hypothetical protein VKG80_04325 [Trebonia sp.]|nr:hypothetical protein [Trebonia sp.]
MDEGEVPGGTSGNAAGGDGEEAVWLDLVARFDAPEPGGAGGDVPWPERESLAGPPVRVTPAVPDALPAEPPANPSGPPANPAGLPSTPDQPWPRLGGALGPRDAPKPADSAEEHFVPPSPPPLPRLDPVTKGAWLALFGGPLYLLIATAVGWNVSGLAAFLAVAAFVGGFAVLVFRMDSRGPRDSGPDDGAVV